MKETNLFSFPTQLKSEAIPSKRNKKKTSIAVFNQVDPLFIEKSANEFANSILLGNLYDELRPKGKKTKSNLTQI
ncbi:MAG: hypothetical protein IPH52_14135 [Leptospiraceae bacterium]|jgi:hypothetical protein|nr:hypothetical protein [Leptospiraceae bacterium]